jgi:hypothetical protein
VLNVPASEMSAVPPSRKEQKTQRAEVEMTRARHRTQHASVGPESGGLAAREGGPMTAGRQEDAAAASAVSQAEAHAEQRATASERQARETSGSDVETSQPGWRPPA